MRPSDSEKEFERLVTEHRATIYTVCYMFSKDADEVADLFQEVLVNLWRGMGGFEGRSDVRTWIYRVSLKKHLREPRLQAAPRHGIARLCLPMRPQIALFAPGQGDFLLKISIVWAKFTNFATFNTK